jgi:hypothetical protein
MANSIGLTIAESTLISDSLTSIVNEHLGVKGFRAIHRESHPARFPIAGSNPKYRRYRSSNVCAETVLVLSNA